MGWVKQPTELRPKKTQTSVSDYMGSENRVGRSDFFLFFANFLLVDSSPYGRIFVL